MGETGCTRCGEDRKVLTMFNTRPGGHTGYLPSEASFNMPEPERVCGNCVTNDELVRFPEICRIAEFALTTMLEDAGPGFPETNKALEIARTFFMVRNNEADHGRSWAVRAVGLD